MQHHTKYNSPLDNLLKNFWNFDMPKLDDTHTVRRIEKRLVELEQGAELAAKDFRAVLSNKQFQAYEQAWAEQQELRKKKRARSKEEEQNLGWKSKREVRIEILKQALVEARSNELPFLKRKLEKLELKRAEIYFDALTRAERAGKDRVAARSFANNQLTQNALQRMDGQAVRIQSKRDKEIFEQEQYLLAHIRSNLSDEELEQVALAEGLDLAELKKKIRKILADYDQK
jgi:hypothetical protein